ncbi:MAG TPA: PAS domain S-box protein, partial [Burkholderiales bacterium]|nr:PAS domain S-box protein [Burkholderiales bacterium]
MNALADLQRERDAVRQAHRQWVDTVDSVRDPIVVHDLENRVVRCNRTYAALAGVDVREAIGKPYWRLFPKLGGPLPGCKHATAGPDTAMEEEFRLPTGELYLSRSFPLAAADGKTVHFLHVMQDITERNRIREAVERSEKRYRALTENGSDLVVVLDGKGTIAYVSPSVKQIVGYEVAEVLGRRYFEFIHPEDLPTAMSRFPAIVANGGLGTKIEFRYRHKDGRWVTLESIARNALGDPLVGGVVINARDVTERRDAERALRDSEARFRAMFDQASVGITQVALDGTFIKVNPAMCSMLGYAEPELLGRTFGDITHAEDREASVALKDALRGSTPPVPGAPLEKRYLRKDGSTLWASVSVAPVRNAQGTPDYFVTIVQNINERKRAQQAARESFALLETAERLAEIGGFRWNIGTDSVTWSKEIYK